MRWGGLFVRHGASLAVCSLLLVHALWYRTVFWGLMLSPLVLLFFLGWLIYGALAYRGDPVRWRYLGAKALIWCATAAFLFALNGHQRESARREADAVAAKIAGHRARHGAYPVSLAEAGVDAEALRQQWKLRYGLIDQRPFLFYPAPATLFDKYVYDFDRAQWEYRPD